MGAIQGTLYIFSVSSKHSLVEQGAPAAHDDHIAKEGGPAQVEEASPRSLAAGEQAQCVAVRHTHVMSLRVAPRTGPAHLLQTY